MADDRQVFEEVLDYVVYAPIGLAVQVSKALPNLISEGRKRVGSRLGVARLVGQFTVGNVRRRLDSFVAAQPDPDGQGAGQADPPIQLVNVAGVVSKPVTTTDRPDPSQLAIPGYDSLAASQVVARLAGLTAAEREEVRAYESAVRGRRTILARIAQLDEEHHGGR